jgi:hypothetical protein
MTSDHDPLAETDAGTSTTLSGSGATLRGVPGASGEGGTTASELDSTTLAAGPAPDSEAAGAGSETEDTTGPRAG